MEGDFSSEPCRDRTEQRCNSPQAAQGHSNQFNFVPRIDPQHLFTLKLHANPTRTDICGDHKSEAGTSPSRGLSPNAWSVNSVGQSMMRAVTQKNPVLLMQVLEQSGHRGDCNVTEDSNWQEQINKALFGAVLVKSEPMVRMLLEAGATGNYLSTAISVGSIDIAKAFLSHGADPNETNEVNETAIHAATRAGNLDVLKLLEQAGGKLEACTGNSGRTPMHIAAEMGHEHIIGYLLDMNCDADVPDEEYIRPIHLLAKHNHIRLLERLLQRGICTIECDQDCLPPWHFAIKRNDVRATELLLLPILTRDSDPSAMSEALSLACTENSQACLSYLLTLCPEQVPLINALGQTLLMWSLNTCGVGVARFLLKKHSERLGVNVVDGSGRTALHYALDICDRGDRNEILYLLRDIPGSLGLTFETMEDVTVLQWLLENGANVNHVWEDGSTSLFEAVDVDHSQRTTSTLQTLYDWNVDPTLSAVSVEGKTPLIRALELGNTDILTFLLAHGCSTRGVLSWLNGNVTGNMDRIPSELIKAVIQIAQAPRRLSEICRSTTLTAIGQCSDLQSKVEALKLPGHLKSFLLYKDFWKRKALELEEIMENPIPANVIQ